MATRAPPAPPAPPASGSATVTVTIDPSHSTSSAPAAAAAPETVVLWLKRRAKKKVSWKEGTVDNESLGRKSSKKCCIFHKEVPFDEDCSDDEANAGRRDPPGDGGCSSSHGQGHRH